MHFFQTRGLLLLAITAIALSGCSRFKLLYSFTGEAIQQQAEFYLDLTTEEEIAFEQNIDALVRWHRAEMLPQYARFLRDAAADIDRGDLSEASVSATIVDLRRLLEATVEGSAPYVATVLSNHTRPKKLVHLRARIAERLAESREDLNVPRTEWIEAKTESAIGRFEIFFGTLTDRQSGMVRTYFAKSADWNEPWQKVREDRREAFLTFLAETPGRDQIEFFLPRILLRSEEIVGPEYKQLADAWWACFTDWMIEMSLSLTQEQRRYFSATLRGYADDMIDLST
ncbi:MAG: DUF6279 family lipoprotein [Rickettsiales bacterium]